MRFCISTSIASFGRVPSRTIIVRDIDQFVFRSIAPLFLHWIDRCAFFFLSIRGVHRAYSGARPVNRSIYQLRYILVNINEVSYRDVELHGALSRLSDIPNEPRLYRLSILGVPSIERCFDVVVADDQNFKWLSRGSCDENRSLQDEDNLSGYPSCLYESIIMAHKCMHVLTRVFKMHSNAPSRSREIPRVDRINL